jgi:hypothetical protein
MTEDLRTSPFFSDLDEIEYDEELIERHRYLRMVAFNGTMTREEFEELNEYYCSIYRDMCEVHIED